MPAPRWRSSWSWSWSAVSGVGRTARRSPPLRLSDRSGCATAGRAPPGESYDRRMCPHGSGSRQVHFGCFPGSIGDGDAAVRRVGLPGFGELRGVDEPDPWATSRLPAPPVATMASWPEASGATGAVGPTPGPWVCLITSRRRCTSIRGTRACPRGRPPARARSAWFHRRAPQGLR